MSIRPKKKQFSTLFKAVSEIILDLAQFQAEHGPESLEKILGQLGSAKKMANRIENVSSELKEVSYSVDIRNVYDFSRNYRSLLLQR